MHSTILQALKQSEKAEIAPRARRSLEEPTQNWRAFHQYVNPPGSELVRLDDTGRHNAEDCLARGRTALRNSSLSEAKRFLRAAPRLATGRRALVEVTLRAAAMDPDFTEFVREADRARDAADWAEGARLYGEALEFYPAHGGYLVQYAHCLKEQRKFAEAEVHYRSALALRAPINDVYEHLEFVASKQGYDDVLSGSAAIGGDVRDAFMEAPPTVADISLAFRLLLGVEPVYPKEPLEILRTRSSNSEVFAWIMGQGRFRSRNRNLFRLLSRSELLP